jgi:glycosyltransferase involved in cell wall biosynthesis
MTIAWILDTFPSLSETFIARDIAALRRQGLNIEVFALRAGEGANSIDVSWTDRARRALHTEAAWHAVGKRIGYEMVSGKYASLGITHIHGGWASHPATIAQGAAREAKLPWSFSGHARDLWVDGQGWPQKLRGARFASACTRRGVSFLQHQALELSHKVLYSPHGLDISEYRYQTVRDESPLEILSVGRLVEKKGLDILLQALALLAQDNFDFKATIIGDGPERDRLARMIAKLKLNGRVSLLGALPQAQVRAAMREAHCFVFSGVEAKDGDRDGLPNVLLEAAALGLPIISSDVGSVRDLGSDEVMQLCPPGEVQALAQGIRVLIANPSDTYRRAQRARQQVELNFDIELTSGHLARSFLDA